MSEEIEGPGEQQRPEKQSGEASVQVAAAQHNHGDDWHGSAGADRHDTHQLFSGRGSAHAGDAEESAGTPIDGADLQSAGRASRDQPLDLVAHTSNKDLQRCTDRHELERGGWMEHRPAHPSAGQRATRGWKCVDGGNSWISAHWPDGCAGDERRGNNPTRELHNIRTSRHHTRECSERSQFILRGELLCILMPDNRWLRRHQPGPATLKNAKCGDECHWPIVHSSRHGNINWALFKLPQRGRQPLNT